jgi:hypothetical protein
MKNFRRPDSFNPIPQAVASRGAAMHKMHHTQLLRNPLCTICHPGLPDLGSPPY